MRFFQPLKDRRIRLLFTGQALSNIGDEVYNVSIVWIAVQLIGSSAGFLSALQAGAILIFSLIGGVWTDRRDQRKVLIFSDIIRGIVVLIPVVYSFFAPLSMAILIPTAFVVSSFTGIFNPAIRSLTPEIVKERNMLVATNALVESTHRFGRAIGPSIVALFGAWVPPIHFFTINSFSYFISAKALNDIGHIETAKPEFESPWKQVKEGVLGGAKMVFHHPPLRFVALSGIISTPTWYLILPLGFALLIHEKMPTDHAALGLLVGSYGIGNVLGNIWVGNVEMKHPEKFLYWGRVIAGLGFMALSFMPTLPGMLITAGIAASGGPLTDIGNVIMVQNQFRGLQAVRVFRFQLAYFFAMILIVYLISPFLFETFGVTNVIRAGGFLIFFAGIIGFKILPIKSLFPSKKTR